MNNKLFSVYFEIENSSTEINNNNNNCMEDIKFTLQKHKIKN
jgi:hypothetical protein